MFGSSEAAPAQEPKLFGQDKNRVSTNESARVLPWFAGTRWLGVTWLGEAFNVKTTPITTKVGKKKQTTGYNYYASFAAMICNGRVERITKIKFDDETVWEGNIVREDEDYVAITIETRGVVYLYWGTETQTLDARLAASGQNHAAYRGQCYMVGDQILFGPDRTNAPNIQVELSRYSSPSWIADPRISQADGDSVHYDVNPVSVIWEWWTNTRFGLGRSESLLDVDRLTDCAAELAAERMGVSPLLSTEQEFRTMLVRMFETVDGYPTSYGGLFGVELVRDSGEGVRRVTESMTMDDPSLSTQQWPDTTNETRVKFVDYGKDGLENSATHQDRANIEITGRTRGINLDRPWVTVFRVAARIAGTIGRVRGIPQVTGSATLRESQSDWLVVGAVFELATRDGELLRLRVTERSEPEPDNRNVAIQFETDRGWANQDYAIPIPEDIPEPEVLEPGTLAVAIINAPYAFSRDPKLTAVIYFAARADTYTDSYNIWRASTEDGSYSRMTSQPVKGVAPISQWTVFATRATLSQEYSINAAKVDESETLRFTVTSADQDVLDTEYDKADGYNHELLGFIGDDGKEIVSLFGITRLSATTFKAKCIRNLYDTARYTHASGTVIWIQKREEINVQEFGFVETERFFKFQPYFAGSFIELADITATAFTENKRSQRALAPKNLKVSGDGNNPTWVTTGDTHLAVTYDTTSLPTSVFGAPINDLNEPDLEFVRLELRSANGATLYSSTRYNANGTISLAKADIVTALGANDFSLRIYGIRGDSLESLLYNSIVVRITS